MALFGTDIERNLRHNNALNEPEWHKIPKEPCLKIWRIEKFCVVPWPEKMYGTFYNGDSFIVLNVTKVNDALDYTAYMWVGNQSTKDETGTAAYKIVELDDFFHGIVDLCYEAQDNESEDFRNLFEEIIVEEGGIESGFKKIEKEKWDVRLLRVYMDGKTPRTQELPLCLSSLTQEDAFILDTGLDLYAWRGEKTKPQMRFSTCLICQKIKDARNGRPKYTFYDEGDKGTKAIMTKYLKEGKTNVVLRARRKPRVTKKMFKLSDANGKLEMSEVKFGADSLNTNDAFLIDNGKMIYVWCGKKCSKNEKRMGMPYAQKYKESTSDKLNCPIALINEGSKKFSFDTAFN
jgi:gelsolin